MGWNVRNIFHALLFMLFVISIEADQEYKFTPSTYDILIETQKEHFEKDDSSSLKYNGQVTIAFKKEPAPADQPFTVSLDTNPNTKIISVEMKGQNTTGWSPLQCTSNLNKDKLIVSCPKEAGALSEFKLTVKYENPFGDDMTGFYRSSYTDSNNKKRWLLTTHFEPVYARNAFPCFDKPHLKAKFTVSVKVPNEIPTVLSNTELYGTPTEGNGFKTFKFKETNIPMSTYLVAFTASDFGATDAVKFKSQYNNGAPIEKDLRTYGRADIIKEDGMFAQLAGKAALEALTKYLGEGYALNKVDQVGIPDFSAGAMENFGHISFREKSLYVNDKTSTMTKQSNLLTIVHELVHQWFGNLVTLENWDYIWLNEAFANYLEYVIASQFDNSTWIEASKWNLMEQLVVNEIHSRAFETDGLTSSKPLTNKITDESLILPAFNDIPYAKGAAVLRMWHLSLPDNKFQDSLKEYIQKRKEQSANPAQLYEAFKVKSGMKEDFFTTWTQKVGYPVVDVQKTGNESYSLTQSRFTWEKSDVKETWEIPITYFTNEKDEGDAASLNPDGKALELKGVKGKWIVVNKNQVGYYRVNYNTENWEALSKALNETDHGKIPALNRAQIINDIFSLARSVQKNYVNYSTAFTLTKYLEKEKDFIPWKTALNAFDFVANKVRKNDETFRNFKSYVLDLIKPHFKNLNSTEANHVEKLKKVDILRWACSLDYEPCVKQASELYNSNKYNDYPDIREILFCTVVRNNKTAWDDIFKKYKDEKDSSLRVMYLTALGCTTDSKKAKEYLESTLKDDSGIRKQDLMFVLSSVYNGNIKNLDTAFDFVEKNFVEISKKYGGINPLGRAIVGIARKLDTEAQCKRLEELVNKVKKNQDVKGADESLDNALKIAKANCDWEKEKISQLNRYFSGASTFASSLSLLLLCLLFIFRF